MCAPRDGRAVAIAVALLGTISLAGCEPEPPRASAADYADLGLPVLCEPSADDGVRTAAGPLETAQGIRYMVRTPANYDPTRGHPLLVVYAPAGFRHRGSEHYTGLTTEATRRGFVVAYVDHRPLSFAWLEALGQVPALVSRHWCIDPGRITLAGHSDGGTTATAVAFLGKATPPPTAVVSSGAGIRGQDLDAYPCPSAPPSVLVVHSSEDRLFPLPEYGVGAAAWWAACLHCNPAPSDRGPDGCVEYGACEGSARVRYCEVRGDHARWPGVNTTVLDFLQQTPRARRSESPGR
jgi:polyhydroxybutyrate depolymerase